MVKLSLSQLKISVRDIYESYHRKRYFRTVFPTALVRLLPSPTSPSKARDVSARPVSSQRRLLSVREHRHRRLSEQRLLGVLGGVAVYNVHSNVCTVYRRTQYDNNVQVESGYCLLFRQITRGLRNAHRV